MRIPISNDSCYFVIEESIYLILIFYSLWTFPMKNFKNVLRKEFRVVYK